MIEDLHVDRRLVLGEILKIERRIKKIEVNPRYRYIRNCIINLESMRFGSQMISIAAPDDPDTTLEFRNNSKEMKDTISRYKELRTQFDDRVQKLMMQKEKLQRQLFKRPH